MRPLADLFPAPLDAHEELKAARQFSRTIEPNAEGEYTWVYDYATARYDELIKIGADLDSKANELIRYLGGGATLFSAAAILNIRPTATSVLAAMLVPFALALLSIAAAILARQPNPGHLPPSVKDTFAYASHYGTADEARAAFIGQWHAACISQKLVNETKASRTLVAMWLFYGSIVALVVPMLAAISTAA